MSTLTSKQIEEFCATLSVGETFVLDWSFLDDPRNKICWECVVRTKGEAGISFNSKDADLDDQGQVVTFDLPDIDDDGTLRYVYHKIVTKPRTVKVGMGAYAKKSLFASRVVAWNPRTWLPFINEPGIGGRELLIQQLQHQLHFPERFGMANFANVSDHDRCAFGEILINYIDLLTVLHPEHQILPQVELLVRPALRRLCEHRAAEPLSGAERTKKMAEVRAEFLRDDMGSDRLSLIMAGLPPKKE